MKNAIPPAITLDRYRRLVEGGPGSTRWGDRVPQERGHVSTMKDVRIKVDELPAKDRLNLNNAMRMTSVAAREMLRAHNITKAVARAKVNEARKIVQTTPSTDARHIDKDGRVNPARAIIHNQAADRMVAHAPTSARPVILITGGLPGSGKSNVLRGPLYAERLKTYARIDNDEAKDILSKADGIKNLGALAASYHRESDRIVTAALEKAYAKKACISLDLSMKNPKKMEAIILDAKRRGYEVELIFVDLPPQKAILRAVGRYLEGKRFVDPATIARHDLKNKKSFNQIKRLATRWTHWNNDVPFGAKPRRVAGKK